ncbi:unnamed protein product [Adineta steineri]|uniref:Uncharacterized protein n=1 Tax=Adineta steineri TaxID=433720 RepID=A0A814VFM3_9BILA|nr:unnamed protein product [Adineta steineri]CAF1186689.1 unnamed protein product [Adineta steineri]CAF3487284.1 unnamed protein product [Adineta steineri]CAF4284444.1 unnamed protein product [Adineta steineri]
MVCCSARLVNNEWNDFNSRSEQQHALRQFLTELIQERTATTSVCQGNVGCDGFCNSGTNYDSSSTCGLACNSNNAIGAFGTSSGKVGATGTCTANSTFCRGGTYTFVRNSFSDVNFDCTVSYASCGSYGGCCVGFNQPNTATKNFYCIKCQY